MTCHAMEDRHAIDRWPLALLVLAAAEIGNLGLVFDGTQDEWPDCWDDMSGHARVLWAKGAGHLHGSEDGRVHRETPA